MVKSVQFSEREKLGIINDLTHSAEFSLVTGVVEISNDVLVFTQFSQVIYYFADRNCF